LRSACVALLHECLGPSRAADVVCRTDSAVGGAYARRRGRRSACCWSENNCSTRHCHRALPGCLQCRAPCGQSILPRESNYGGETVSAPARPPATAPGSSTLLFTTPDSESPASSLTAVLLHLAANEYRPGPVILTSVITTSGVFSSNFAIADAAIGARDHLTLAAKCNLVTSRWWRCHHEIHRRCTPLFGCCRSRRQSLAHWGLLASQPRRSRFAPPRQIRAWHPASFLSPTAAPCGCPSRAINKL